MYPNVLSKEKVGTYPAFTKAGGGYVWDEVLEHRVWCHPHEGAEDLEDDNDYYYAFDTYEDALVFSESTAGAECVLALILQREYIDEPEAGKYVNKKSERIAECRISLTPKTSSKYDP